MKISYIIPVYNVPAEMLAACLGSIQACLGAASYEIIIVDDGSEKAVNLKDLEISKLRNLETSEPRNLETSKIKLIRQENQGLSAARNTGIAAATGDYIQFIDADDMLIPGQYTRVLELLLKTQADIVNFGFDVRPPMVLNMLRKPEPLRHPMIPITTGTAYLLNNNLRVAACFYVFKREILGDLRFEKDLKNEDERFTPQLYLRVQTVVATDIPAYFYRQRDGSLQHSYSEEFIEKRLKDFFSTIVFLKKLNEPALKRRINQMSMDFIYNAICLTHNKEGLHKAIEALRKEGIFPLPHRRYTLKYWLFSYISDSRVGQWLLEKLLPLMPREV